MDSMQLHGIAPYSDMYDVATLYFTISSFINVSSIDELGRSHTESTQHESIKSPPPLYPTLSQIRLSLIGGIHVTSHIVIESMRFVQH